MEDDLLEDLDLDVETIDEMNMREEDRLEDEWQIAQDKKIKSFIRMEIKRQLQDIIEDIYRSNSLASRNDQNE